MLIWALPAALLISISGQALCQQTEPGQFTLVRDGRPAATIVTDPDQGPSVEFAVAELNHHLRKMTGCELPVRSDGQAAGPSVLVGHSEATRRMGISADGFGDQEYAVRVTPDALVLTGRDTPSSAEKADSSTPEWVEGKFGKAVQFDGLHHALSVGDCGFSDEMGSLECWVKLPAEVKDQEETVLRLDGGGPWTYHILRRIANTRKVGYFTYDGETVRGVGTADLSEGWHHILATYDANKGVAELFLDGVKQGSMQYIKTTCKSSKLEIGGLARGSNVGNPLRGVIDEIRVSSVVRDPAVDANGGPYETDDATSLLAHLDEGKGTPRLGNLFPYGVKLPGFFEANGSLYAVYDLLEKYCGVRWYAPGDVGTVTPEARTLTVSGPDLQRKPAMRYRWITPTRLYMPRREDVVPGFEVDLWKLRMRIGGEDYWACHSFGGFYDRFLKDHPEWFAQGYGGRPPQMCYSNPGLVQQVVTDARNYFDGKGGGGQGNYFGVVPEDNSSYCKCPDCVAAIDLRDEGNEQFSRGLVSNYVWGFVNDVAKGVRETHPDKWIGALAYARYAYYPDKVELEPNILVQMCLHTRNWWAPYLAKNDQKIYDDWVNKEGKNRPVYLWLYYNFPAMMGTISNFEVFPGFFVHTAIDQMKMYHQSGIKGIFMEHSSEFAQSFLQDQLDMYVTLRLADDPDLDGEAMVDEFFRLYYGAAGEPMKQLYFAIEDAYSDPGNYSPEVQNTNQHYHQTEEMAWQWLGTEERMARFAGLMEQARTQAQTDIEKQRVDLFDRGIWQYMVDGRKQWVERQAQRGAVDELKQSPPPTVSVPRIPAPDGRDPKAVDWTRAAELGNWRHVVGHETQAKVSAWIAHDGANLYIKLQDQTDPTKLVSAGDVYSGDDWEVFVAPQRAEPYRQIGVAPNGKGFEGGRGDGAADWAIGAQFASDVSDAGRWVAYVTAPLASIIPGGVSSGSVFFANLYRSAQPGNLLAWSPNFTPSFHVTERMGEFRLE